MKSPAFRFYPSDFVGSPDVQAMEPHEIGGYILLLCMAWNSDRHGYLPDDENLLRRWSKLTREQWAESRELILKKFPGKEEGWRTNPRMVLEAEKQRAFSEAQSMKGKQGGRPKNNPGLSKLNPGLSKSKPEESPAKAGEKPSVYVSVSKEQVPFAPATQAPGASESEAKAKAPSEEELVWGAYPLKKGKTKAIPIIRKIIADLRKQGVLQPAALLVERIECWEAKRQKDEAAGLFVPEKPYPQKFFGRGDWDDDDAKPRAKAQFFEVSADVWHGQTQGGE